MSNLNIVDVSAVMHVYYKNRALPDFSWEVDGIEFPTKAMFGLFQLFKRMPKGKVAFCFDRRSIRKDMLDTYKAGRPKAEDNYIIQVTEAENILIKSGYNVFAEDGYEADDLIVSICRKYSKKYDKTFVWSNDRDLTHLIDKNVSYKSVVNRLPDIDMNNYEKVLGIPYNTIILFKSLVGDTSDNVPGIPGFGPKTFNTFIDKLIKEGVDLVDVVGSEKDIIEKYFDGVQRNQALKGLEMVVPMEKDLVLTNKENSRILTNEILRYGMKSLVNSIF